MLFCLVSFQETMDIRWGLAVVPSSPYTPLQFSITAVTNHHKLSLTHKLLIVRVGLQPHTGLRPRSGCLAGLALAPIWGSGKASASRLLQVVGGLEFLAVAERSPHFSLAVRWTGRSSLNQPLRCRSSRSSPSLSRLISSAFSSAKSLPVTLLSLKIPPR